VEERGERKRVGEALPHLIDFHAKSVKHTQKPNAIINNMLKTFNC